MEPVQVAMLDRELEEAAQQLVRDRGVAETQALGPFGLRVTLAVLALVVVADLCLYGAFGGSGMACLLAVTTAAVTVLCPPGARHVHRGLLLSIALVCLVSVWNHFWLVSLMGWTAVLAYAIKLHNPHWRITEHIVAFALLLLAAPARVLGHLTGVHQWAAARRNVRGIPSRIVLIPAAVCLLFVIIFVSANPVVARVGSGVGERLVEMLASLGGRFSIWRVLFWVLWVVAFTILISPSVRNRLLDRLAALSERLVAPAKSQRRPSGARAEKRVARPSKPLKDCKRLLGRGLQRFASSMKHGQAGAWRRLPPCLAVSPSTSERYLPRTLLRRIVPGAVSSCALLMVRSAFRVSA